jgi:imidazolonepropionase-like amidohydrolase
MTKQDSIEHLSGYPLGIGSLNRDLAEASRAAGVWNCPTMYVCTRSQNHTVLAARRALVGALDEAGARILAGTDSGYVVPAGIGLHEELRELREAGLTPFETLSAATRSAAEYLGDASIGTIHLGARADLLLVAVNPPENLSTLRTPSGVMGGGGCRTGAAGPCGIETVSEREKPSGSRAVTRVSARAVPAYRGD